MESGIGDVFPVEAALGSAAEIEKGLDGSFSAMSLMLNAMDSSSLTNQ